jgi:hypothetical protein
MSAGAKELPDWVRPSSRYYVLVNCKKLHKKYQDGDLPSLEGHMKHSTKIVDENEPNSLYDGPTISEIVNFISDPNKINPITGGLGGVIPPWARVEIHCTWVDVESHEEGRPIMSRHGNAPGLGPLRSPTYLKNLAESLRSQDARESEAARADAVPGCAEDLAEVSRQEKTASEFSANSDFR